MTQDLIGTRKGDYEILALLGVGGMGQVYKVRNVLSDRVEAMKVLLPNLADQKMLADRFIREIKVLAGLHHPNIAELRTALTIDNQLVMIMEFVEGSPLSSRVLQGGIPYGQALGYIQQVLAALSYAHSQKIIHRDIKPANMMLTPKAVVKLMDFGIARQEGDVALTTTNSTVGSIAYMSPEQVKGEPVDARSDLYSVGVSLYELVTGQRPFQGDTGFSIMRAHLETIPKPPIELRPDLPVGISDLILMAVAKDPAKRFQSADAFSRAIGSLLPVVESTAATFAMPASAPTVIAPSPLGATMVSNADSSPFQATQVAAASPSAAPQSAARSVTPVPSKPASQPARPPQSNYRGFYIALGALIVLVALTAAGFYLPRHLKTQAAQQTTASSDSNSSASNSTPDSRSNSSTTQPASAASDSASNNSSSAPGNNASGQSSSSPAATTNSSQSANSPAAPASGSTANPPHLNIPPRAGAQQTASTDSNAPVPHINIPPRSGSPQAAPASTSSAAPANASSQSPAAPPPQSNASESAPAKPVPADAPQLQETETEVDQLSSRASAVSASLDGLRKQQAAQGLDLRGDMTAAEQRMQTNISKAQEAIQAQDATQAKRYMDLAEPDVEKLERFLGH
jgi:serine/threonine-protein kinase